MRRERQVIALLALGALLVLGGLLLRTSGEPDGAAGAVRRPTAGSTPPDLVEPTHDEPRLDGRAPTVPEPPVSRPRRRAVEAPPAHDVVACIAGRVVDEKGRPVPNASVHTRLPRGKRVEDRTDTDGRYRLRIPWKGPYAVHGKADGFGTGTLEDVVVERDGDLEPPPLILGGAGWFSGVVLFPDGTPADGVAVEAAVSMKRGGSWAASPEPGLIHSVSITDAEGRFRSSGLRLGPYVVKAPRVSRQDVSAAADHRQQDVRLVLQSRRVRIVVLNDAGRPLPEALVHVTRLWGTRRGWGFSRSRRPDGVLELWGQPRDHDLLYVTCKGHLATEHSVDFRESVWSRDETVVLARDDVARGEVALALQRQDGTWIRGLSASLRSASGMYRVPGFRRVDGDGDDVINLPPGRWTLEVAPTASHEDEDYEGYDFPAWGTIEVVAGERRNLSLMSRQGGRVRVLGKRGPGIDPEVDLTVSLGLVVPPELEGDEDRDYENLDWSLDEPMLSQIVAPGPWLLEVEGYGVKTELRRVIVRAGRTLDVHVTLVPDSPDGNAEESEE